MLCRIKQANAYLKLGKSRLIKQEPLATFYSRLVSEGIDIRTIYDIGAFEGKYTQTASQFFPKANFILFEANPIHEPKLKSTGHRYFVVTLYSEKTHKYWYSLNISGDSLYKENNFFGYTTATPSIVETETLDSIVNKHLLPVADLIKIDTQGSELDILLGAQQTVKTCKLITLEMPLVNYNIGAPKIQEYIDVMRSIGFAPYDFVEPHFDKGLLIQIDLAFINTQYLVDRFGEIARPFL